MFKLSNIFKRKKSPSPISIACRAVGQIFSRPADYMIVEIQTTGIEDCRIVEIAMCDVYGNIRYSQLINPQCHMPEATTLHNGITDQGLEGQPLIIDELMPILRYTEGKILISWDSDFVFKVLSREIAPVFKTPISEQWVSVKELWERIIGQRVSIEEAFRQRGMEMCGSHRAADNCLDTLKFLSYLPRTVV